MWKGIATKVNRRYVLAVALFLVMLVLVLAAYLYERSKNERLRSELSQYNGSQGEGSQNLESLSEEDRENVILYSEALGAVRGDYVDRESIDSKDQTYEAIKGMLGSLGDERHTRFLSPEEVDKTRKALSNKQVETGISR